MDAAVARAAGDWVAALQPADGAQPPEPCEHLGANGCTFPDDLRPFGCTAYLCPIMHRELERPALDRLRRLIRRLEAAHRDLMRQWAPPPERGDHHSGEPPGGARRRPRSQRPAEA